MRSRALVLASFQDADRWPCGPVVSLCSTTG